jgi:hypothetical protein
LSEQNGLFARAKYLNPKRCPKLGHRSRPVTHTVTTPTGNPRRPEKTFDVCSECGRTWEKVRGATVTKIKEVA